MNYSNLKFALFGNIYQTKKNQYVARIFKKLEELGVQIWVESDFADFIDHNLDVVLNNVEIFSKEKLPQVDVAISIGGDGTFLGTAALVGSSGIPILGINTGRLGFLATSRPRTSTPRSKHFAKAIM